MSPDTPIPPQRYRLENTRPIKVRNLDLGSEQGDSTSSLNLTVQIVPDDKQSLRELMEAYLHRLWDDAWMRGLLIFIAVAAIGFLIQRAWFFHSTWAEKRLETLQVEIGVEYPIWVALSDEETFSITFFNYGGETLKQPEVLLLFQGGACILTGSSECTIMKVESLPEGARVTKTIHFRLSEIHGAQRNLTLVVQLTPKDGLTGTVTKELCTMGVLPKHYKTIVQRVWMGLISVLLLILEPVREAIRSVLGSGK